MADNSSIPVTSGSETFANKDIAGVKFPRHITVDSTGSDVAVATSAKQDTGNGSLATIATNTTGAATATLQTTGNTSLATIAGAVSAAKIATKAASGDFADGAINTLGARADAKSTATDATPVSGMQVFKQISASIQALVTAIGSTAWDLGSGTGGTRTQRVMVDTSQIGAVVTTAKTMADGYTQVGLPTDQPWGTGMSPKGFAAAFTTLTRPANATSYTKGDSISNSATAASVTALSATVSDTNNHPVTVTEILVTSSDTGLGGKRLRANIFNADPTTSTGVGAGDNAAYSNKRAGYVGSFAGIMEAFSDGSAGRLVPSMNDGATSPTPYAAAGGHVVTLPSSGGKLLYIQFIAGDDFTPSASSTTITATARGFQGRAA